ncbi:serine/threonine protein kinase [Aquabacterium lacunae]|uniref:serine/threonine protein kinase n=1 Tax=Aquabacterium lacunae TaxID=2528630 RepID=UPI0013EF527F|nr:serine/threonine-protein kinase [Aquabacterium lacunae]
MNTSSSVPPASRDTLPVGFQLNEYVVEGVLGVGGFGVVYRAHDPQLQRQVAIKEYLPVTLAARGDDGGIVLRSPQHRAAFELGLQSFVNEARLLARFDHPSLVRVFRFWEAQGTAYMVMPCYEGATLYTARKAMSAPPSQAWLRALMEPLLGALELLHREQVYHRDVAPDNILIVPDADAPEGMRPVLLDFGAARRVISDHTQSLTAILKPSFAPIEQYAETSHLRQGAWTDLYALAAVLHYCLTGRTPVPSTARAVHDDLAPLSSMADELGRDFGQHYPPALLETIDRGLAVRPEHRLASVAQWRASLLGEPLPPVTQSIMRTTQAPVRPDPASAPAREPTFAPTMLVSRPDAVSHEATGLAEASASASSGGMGMLTGLRQSAWFRAAALGLAGMGLVGLAVLWAGRGPVTGQPDLQAQTPQAGLAASATVAAPAGASLPTAGARGVSPPAVSAAEPPRERVAERAPEQPDRREAQRSAGQASQRTADTERAPSRAPERTAERPQASADSARSPADACGGRIFIAHALCMKRQCERPRFKSHAQCVKLRQQEADQRKALEGV